MRAGQPSQTARGAAAYRAIHQRFEGGAIFKDPFAVRILDEETRAALNEIAADPAQRQMRLFITARSRFAEDALSASVARGVRQVVVLGAGLDTFSLRNPFADRGVRVFEVDHPATQAWKRERLAEAGLALPSSSTFAPVDFERQSLAEGLTTAGFERDRPAFFQWLGVVPYLTYEAISSTLDFIAGIPASAVAFDYTEPFQNHSPERRASLMATAERAAARGEPWLSFFDPGELFALLRAKGFSAIEDLGFAEMVNRFSPTLGEGLQRGPGGHVISAEKAIGPPTR
jgi:methyltransferase (TIGR00027 family)